jgi:hypothetical protein
MPLKVNSPAYFLHSPTFFILKPILPFYVHIAVIVLFHQIKNKINHGTER